MKMTVAVLMIMASATAFANRGRVEPPKHENKTHGEMKQAEKTNEAIRLAAMPRAEKVAIGEQVSDHVAKIGDQAAKWDKSQQDSYIEFTKELEATPVEQRAEVAEALMSKKGLTLKDLMNCK